MLAIDLACISTFRNKVFPNILFSSREKERRGERRERERAFKNIPLEYVNSNVQTSEIRSPRFVCWFTSIACLLLFSSLEFRSILCVFSLEYLALREGCVMFALGICISYLFL